jgi:cysteinyl-tRNA synthetase
VIKIYNSLTNKRESLELKKDVSIYLCGPTVYDFIHIGNARPLLFFDVVRRYLELFHNVYFIQNFTDIDDKIINKAFKDKITIKEVSEKYIEEYFKDADRLNVKRATISPKATDYVERMISMIQDLLDKNFAYKKSDGIYFSINKLRSYGELSNRKIDNNIDNDFALWKFENASDISWEASFGKGRPGWHTECVCMIEAISNNVDIHCGGEDLKFPHHENEIAQYAAWKKEKLSRYWMHNSFIKMSKEKMSKSKGNIILVRDLLDKYSGNEIRFFMLSTHYRKPISFSEESIVSESKAFKKIEAFLNCNAVSEGDYEFSKDIEDIDNNFHYYLSNDFNVQGFFGFSFELIKKVNSINIFNDKSLQELKKRLLKCFEILGFKISVLFDEDIDKLVRKRLKLKIEKSFEEADRLRSLLKDKGVEVVDGTHTSWYSIS